MNQRCSVSELFDLYFQTLHQRRLLFRRYRESRSSKFNDSSISLTAETTKRQYRNNYICSHTAGNKTKSELGLYLDVSYYYNFRSLYLRSGTPTISYEFIHFLRELDKTVTVSFQYANIKEIYSLIGVGVGSWQYYSFKLIAVGLGGSNRYFPQDDAQNGHFESFN